MIRADLHGIVIALCLPAVVFTQSSTGPVSARAKQVHDAAIVVDSHDDTTQRLVFDKTFDIGARNTSGNVDIPRMRDGGLDALFFSIWVPSDVTGADAVKRAMAQIAAVRQTVREHPKDLVLATTAAEVRKAAAGHRIAALMGVEGGHMIADSLATLREYAALGVRYMTLTHFKNNNWADSSTDKPAHNGLTAFGKDVVREMNHLGVIVDISHVADKTFFDALAITAAPVIASHSSCRAIANHPRNMTDDMLRALAKNGGVVMINYHAAFLSEPFRLASEKRSGNLVAAMEAMSKRCGGNEACTTLEGERLDHEAMAKGELPTVTWEAIIEHIDHAVKVAGIDHVGLGSDFDGATMPIGMEDASKLPRITDALLKKGYTEKDVTKILGGNMLRVMEAVEREAAKGMKAAFTQPPVFEVISIKPARSRDPRTMRMRVPPSGDLIASSVPVPLLVRYAYDVPINPSPRLSGLPEWRETYDIEAKASANAVPIGLRESETRRRMQGMIRGLLADRFKLVMRVEQKTMPVYALTVAKGGPNLQKSPIAERDCMFDTGTPDGCHNFIMGRGHPLRARAITMDDLVQYIENWTDLPVVNRTGLEGLFAVETEGWKPMRLPPPPPGSAPAARYDDLPTIFTVLRPLGLELKQETATVPVYKVEQIERPSTE